MDRRTFVATLPALAVLADAVPSLAEDIAPRPNLLILGANSLTGLPKPLGAMLECRGIHMNIALGSPKLDAVSQALSLKPAWDYLIMDAWHFGRGRTDPPDFSKAVAAFVREVRTHSPHCKIIWPYTPSTSRHAGLKCRSTSFVTHTCPPACSVCS